jgi:hypothetical protein
MADQSSSSAWLSLLLLEQVFYLSRLFLKRLAEPWATPPTWAGLLLDGVSRQRCRFPSVVLLATYLGASM